MKKLKAIIVLLLLTLFINITIKAYDLDKDDKIYVSGEAIGLKLNTGVIVEGTYGIYDNENINKPWLDAGLKEGDQIIKYGDISVESVNDLKRALALYMDTEKDIVYLRGTKQIESKITPSKVDDEISLGLYIKDNIMGVGTLTYYIKECNIFGSLGHKILDEDGNINGDIYEASINKIKKPTRSNPGEKVATINNKDIGDIKKNTITGVHGYSNDIDTKNMELLGFKTQDDVDLGPAEIWTVVDNDKVEKFDILITDLKKQKNRGIKGISFKVTDEELIEKTGGIVQGMSGSPIVQDNKLIGAVTHVTTQDSTKGYGIYIEFMFEDMGVYVVD